MPWCSTCDRFLNPNTVTTDGNCPSCGRPVDASPAAPVHADPADPDGPAASADVAAVDDEVRAPWHFWVMVAGVAAYLGWRLVQGIFWAAQHWF